MLKSGTRIEDRRLREADALVKCLAFDAITAWRVFSLDRYARDAPDTPDEVLSADERQVIGAVVQAEDPAAAGRARAADSPRHPQPGRGPGAHGGLAVLEAAAAARQRSAVARLRAAPDDGAPAPGGPGAPELSIGPRRPVRPLAEPAASTVTGLLDSWSGVDSL